MGRPERPIDPSSSPVAAFAVELRAIRKAAGNPSYRTLSRRANFSPSVLSAATSGFTLPTMRVTLAFVEACGGDRLEWARRWAAVARTTDRGKNGLLDSSLGQPPTGEAASAWSPTPAQLPAGSRHFAGRDADYARLTTLARPAGNGYRAPVLIGGPVGVGKSALAVRWGLQSRREFPDGSLYVDLGGAPAYENGPDEVLAHLLRSLGTPEECIPSGTWSRASLYRSMVAQRRLLVVLDNATDEVQLRPLLAESATSQILITSRSRLTGLDGVERLRLDTLPPEGSSAVFAAIVGQDRVEAEWEAAYELAELCDGLPLTLRAAAVHMTVRSGWTFARTVERLRDKSHRLSRLRSGDLDLRERLRSACGSLDESGWRVLECLARSHQQPVDARRVAECLGKQWHTVEDVVEGLVDAGLVCATAESGFYRLPALFGLITTEMVGRSTVATIRPLRQPLVDLRR